MMAIKNKVDFFSGNYYKIIIYRLLIAFILLWLSRALFYVFNTSYFSHLSFGEVLWILFCGIRFDLSSLFLLNSPFIILMALPLPLRKYWLYRSFSGFFFYLGNIAGLMTNFIDIIYFRFTQKRMTGDIFSYLQAEGNVKTLIPQFLQNFWYVLLLFLAFVAAFVFFSEKLKFNPARSEQKSIQKIFVFYAFQMALFLAVAGISVVAIRGGFQLKPINIITAGNYTEARNAPLLLNTPFTIMKTFNQAGLEPVHYFDNEKLSSIYSPVHPTNEIQVLYCDTTFVKKNVVIIIMESFSSEHIGAFNKHIPGYQGFTPFLDSLIGESMVFDGFSNGKQSIEGIPAVVASLPSLMSRPYIISPYAGNKINSLASLLKNKGYSTSFFHGGTNGTMNFDGFASMAGFDRYYGRTEYDNEADFDGNWGIFDEPFFQYFAQNLAKTAQPFFTTIFSLSSHQPYTVPEKYKGQFRKGKLEIQEAVMYADFSLKRFFETASKMSWYKNTIFVITADHSSESMIPEYQTRLGLYRIPILFFDPSGQLKGKTTETAAQVDIMPSVLSILNFDKPLFSFGNNLFDTHAKHFAVNYLNSIYQLISNGYILEFDGSNAVALYNFGDDTLLTQNLLERNSSKTAEMLTLLKAYLQQFNNRMIENRLTEAK
jgi:phosphoglycerol transferase MdoB-like AlkP superfamily enzyme